MAPFKTRKNADTTADLRRNNSFRKAVLEVVRRIPKGKALTYKEVAAWAGRPGAYRAVGNILSKNRDPKIPCHRVIRSDGGLGGYNRGAKRKAFLLKKEGAMLVS